MISFKYKILSEAAMKDLGVFRDLYEDVKDRIETTDVADGRCASLALTHLEESFMWVGKMLRDK